MASTTSWEIEQKYGVKNYTRWHLVPANLKTRSWYAERGIKIHRDTKPDATKFAGQTMGKPRVSFLFDTEKHYPEYFEFQMGRGDEPKPTT